MSKKKPNSGLGLGRKYKGNLGKPMDVEGAYESYVGFEKERRLVLLFRELGVRRGDWKALALCLAEWHVPGFQITYFDPERRGGRPSKKAQADEEALSLTEVVDSIRAEAQEVGTKYPRRRLTIGACEYLATSPEHARWNFPPKSTAEDRGKWIGDMQKMVSRGRKLLKDRAQPVKEMTQIMPKGHPLDGLLKEFQKPQ